MPRSQEALQRRNPHKNVVEFPRGSELHSYKQRISQRDLIEERILTNEAARSIAALNKKREEIRCKLERGVPIEHGNHWAYLSSRNTRAGDVRFALVVR